jgi:ribosomal protein L7/L12
MEPTQDTNDKPVPVDVYWIVANIFAIIHLIEEKFGPTAVESIVAVATNIENSMRAEENTETE